MRLINLNPSRPLAAVLGLIPFLILLLLYVGASDARLAENPNDKLLPGLTSMVDSVQRLAFSEDLRSGEYLLWADTEASLKRLATGLAVSAGLALVVGILLGTLPYFRALAGPIVAAISMVPPMAILPILFIVFGLGELSKVVLIVIGTAPVMIRDMAQRVLDMPREQFIKLQTLGGNVAGCFAAAIAKITGRSSTVAGSGLAVSDSRRSNCFDRWPWLSNLSGTSLSGHGCDLAICRLDYPVGLVDGYRSAGVVAKNVSLVPPSAGG